MSYRLHIRPEAEIDIEEAAIWYEKQQKSLGDDFLDEIQTSLEIISDNPYLYAEVHKQVHRALIHRFPFAIYYLIEEELLIIVAVMHGSRHPARWQKRT
ncbi:MAG: type II toxin-antitoxin system RelE/ParE family toxin [Gammaproteobacteria bacterium]|nr:type II toxin-antitoxin system RelE/ParE family toxin [Gammaproteobacteria bacterium]